MVDSHTKEEAFVPKTARRVALAAVAFMALGALPSSAAEDPQGPETHCVVEVTGQRPDGEYTTTRPVCGRSRPNATTPLASSTLAVHYSGPSFTGSTFTVTGSGCSGGWLNFPSQWTNVISSTWSYCAVSHFDFFYLTGDVEVTYSPANLGSLNNRTNSARYS